MAERDDAWQRFFEESNALQEIARQGYTYVTADDLKRYGRREPRLMAKIDTLAERPRSFREHQLAIFPTRNGLYILFQDPDERSYYRFGDESSRLPIEQFISRADLLAYDSFPGPQRLNESQAIDFAYISSLLQHFTGESQLSLAIRGRTFSNPFHFYLPESRQQPNSLRQIDVAGVQIEVDAGYESPKAIYLIEAKVGRREDFNIRQLYYPYLEWSTRSSKRIVPIFLVYTNGKYYLTEFGFAAEFGKLTLQRNACYVIDEDPRPPLSLAQLLATLPPDATLCEPEGIPFPQADDLDKVLDVVAKVEEGIVTKQEIAAAFEFDERQGDYYANAAAYLAFLQRQGSSFTLTEAGRNFLQTRSRSLRNEAVVRQLLLRPTYRAIFRQWQAQGFAPEGLSTQQIAATIATHTTLSGSTPSRRASTVRGWLATLLQNAELIL